MEGGQEQEKELGGWDWGKMIRDSWEQGEDTVEGLWQMPEAV